ncbi:putative RNA-directed DNA polymerase [Tanacetum coccineum]
MNLTLAKENQFHFEEYLSNNANVSPRIDLIVTVLTTIQSIMEVIMVKFRSYIRLKAELIDHGVPIEDSPSSIKIESHKSYVIVSSTNDNRCPCDVVHKIGIAERIHRHLLMTSSSVLNGKSPFSLVYAKAPSSSLNDDEKGSSGRDGNVHQPVTDSQNQPRHDDQNIATRVDDRYSFRDRCNVVVLSWILGSLSQDVYLGLFFDNVALIWKELQETYDRIDGSIVLTLAELIDHGKLMRLMQFLMGLNDVYQPIRSSISTREILLEVRDAFLIIAREESHRGILLALSRLKSHKPLNPNLKVPSNFNNNKNNNVDAKTSFMGNNEIRTSTGSLSFTNEQVQKLMSLLNDKSGSAAHANMAGELIHLDVWGPYKVVSREGIRDVKFYETIFPYKMSSDSTEFSKSSENINNDISTLNLFDNFESETTAKTSSSPNDDKEGPSGRDGNVHQPVPDFENQPGHGDQHFATHVDDENPSEGNGGSHLEVPIFENINQNETEEVSPDIRRSSRPSKLPAKLNEFVLDGKVKYCLHRYANHTLLRGENYCFVTNLNKSIEPSSFEEALKDINWINAMNEELHALYENNTWELCDLPVGRKPIGSKWVYRIKYMSSGEIERFNARLVAKRFGQKEGIDYEETFSPVVKMGTVRCVLTLAVEMNWKFFQMDVNNAFLYGDLDEEVYMLPPLGQWNHKLTEALRDAGFVQSKNDHSLFVKNVGSVFLYVLVYVDDLAITGNDELEIENFKRFLKNKFKIKDLGKLKYFLGIEVLKTKTGLCLTQRKYCLELLHDFGLLGCKPVMTPLPENIVLAHKESENDKFLVNFANYQRLVGKLIYLTLTRPDISYVVHCLSQHMHSPLKSHLDIAMRVLKYLKLAPGYGIQFSKRNSVFDINAFFDSDWAKCPVTRRSVSGYCVFVNGCLVSWKSKKQSTLSRSSAEAKYRSMASVTCEIMWIVKIMKDLNVDNMIPANLYCDNKSAIQIAANPVMHEKTKHFDLDVHLVRKKVSFGLIKTVKVDSRKNVADVLTKALGSYQHSYLVKKFGMLNMFGL